MPQISRRNFLAALASTSLGLSLRGEEPTYPPIRQITKGPGFHWFGYYDKHQFSPDNRYVLSNKVSFEHRSPTADDIIEVGMVDLMDGDKWIPLGNIQGLVLAARLHAAMDSRYGV
jgi:hypothetical protein